MNVLFFGQLREVLQTDSLQINVAVSNVFELRRELQDKGPLWHDSLERSVTLVAVNQTMANEDTLLEKSDEVAFFPPVTGG
ncbi:MAG: molybdopterin synthase sulfur carrier subunit [Paraglaciecola sp.]|jgi:molybdopterin synthase sulfur carrier subunit